MLQDRCESDKVFASVLREFGDLRLDRLGEPVFLKLQTAKQFTESNDVFFGSVLRDLNMSLREGLTEDELRRSNLKIAAISALLGRLRANEFRLTLR